MTKRNIEPKFARRFCMLIGGTAFMFFGGAVNDFAAHRWLPMTIDLVGVAIALVGIALVERQIPEHSDEIGAAVAQMPNNRRAGLRDYLS